MLNGQLAHKVDSEGKILGIFIPLNCFHYSDSYSASLTTSLSQTGSRKESFSLPAYCGEDAIFNRRCVTCHQRIFPEGEHYIIAQSLLFHVTCFQCSICATRCDVTDYCYVMEHEKFYCLRHYHEMVAAGRGIGDEGRIVNGTGPGAFAGRVAGYDVISTSLNSFVNLITHLRFYSCCERSTKTKRNYENFGGIAGSSNKIGADCTSVGRSNENRKK
jgi:hypothetical protein